MQTFGNVILLMYVVLFLIAFKETIWVIIKPNNRMLKHLLKRVDYEVAVVEPVALLHQHRKYYKGVEERDVSIFRVNGNLYKTVYTEGNYKIFHDVAGQYKYYADKSNMLLLKFFVQTEKCKPQTVIICMVY
jgi:hypothetical protein